MVFAHTSQHSSASYWFLHAKLNVPPQIRMAPKHVISAGPTDCTKFTEYLLSMRLYGRHVYQLYRDLRPPRVSSKSLSFLSETNTLANRLEKWPYYNSFLPIFFFKKDTFSVYILRMYQSFKLKLGFLFPLALQASDLTCLRMVENTSYFILCFSWYLEAGTDQRTISTS